MISKMNRRGGAALAIALAGAVAMPGLALADIVTNNITSTASGKVLTIQAGSTATVAYSVQNQNEKSGDTQNSCNPADGTGVQIEALSLPTGTSANKPVATDCATNVAQIVFDVVDTTPVGDYAITHRFTDLGGGVYTDSANFTLRVTAPPAPPAPTDAAAPTTTVTASVPSGGVGGYVSGTWTNETVTVSLSASDDGGSGVKEIRYTTDGTTPSKTSGTVYSEALSFGSDGITTIKYAAVDNDGNVEAVQSFVVKIDKTAPNVTPGDVIEPEWRNSSLSETFTAEDLGSGLADVNDASFSLAVSDDSANPTTATTNSRTVTDNAGNSTTRIVSAFIDTVAPSITNLGPTAGPNGQDWYSSPVTNRFSVEDALSGVAPSIASPFAVTTGAQEGAGLTVSSGSVSDRAGNTAAAATSGAFNVDLSDPTNVQFVGGPAAGSSHYFGTVPTVPACTADDAVSGIASCSVSGHSTSPGTHTLTATATDVAGRTATATRTYTVLNWNTAGFFSPVDIGKVTNSVKGGSTVPLKFEVFAGAAPAGELTTLQAIGATLKVTKITCDAAAAIDEIEVLASGSTSLRYDTTAGQFIYNWKTPTGSACYRTSVTLADGSVIQADFKTR